jgi:hypothetical protein
MRVMLQVSVLDKSKMDWQDFKKTDKEIQVELEAHARSDKQYLDRKVRVCGVLKVELRPKLQRQCEGWEL